MKALVLTKYNRLVYQDAPDPQISGDEVLIRVEACGICGSDVHGMDGSSGRRVPPIIMGHEAAGVIAEAPPGVSDLSVGDRVTFDSTIYCGACAFCRRGLINLCEDRRVFGVSCDEYRRDGAFAEFVAAPRRIVYPLPDAVTFEQAALVEPLSVAFHAVEQTPKRLNDTAVVVGAGMIGLLIIQTLRLAGCGAIIAIDIDSARLELAQQLGADEGLLLDEGADSAEALGAVERLNADIAFEVVGATPPLQTAVASLRKGGALGLVGNVTPTVELPLQAVVTRQISLHGSCASSGEYPACLDMIARGAVDVEALVSAQAPLSEGAEWFQRLYAREPGLMKVVLKP